MKIAVELSEEDIAILKERQQSRAMFVKAGMDEKEPFDFVVQKVLNAAEPQPEGGAK